MKVVILAALFTALVSLGALADPSHHRTVMFGDEAVTLKFNTAPSEELYRLWDATNEARDPVEQERLWRIRWEDYGEAIALQSLANFHLERGDLIQAYAHRYAVDRLAKWYAEVAAEGLEPVPGGGRYLPPGPLQKKHFAEIAAEVELLGKELTTSQRKAGVKLAAQLIRNNPSCCRWP